MASDFSLWFKEQFGAMPNPERRAKLVEEKASLEYQLGIINDLLEKEIKLQDQFTAALYAKQAKVVK